MAPEQSAGQPLSVASDWYSVGVMLWEVLFGQRPFEGYPEEVLRQKRAGPPPLEAGVLPAEHADLAALCRQLLEPDVAARPSEEEILGQLRRGTSGDALPPQGASSERLSGNGDRHPTSCATVTTDTQHPAGASPRFRIASESIFVGRTEPSRRLMEAYVQSGRGQTTSALVHGPPGIGKTALVEHFLQRVEQKGEVLVLRGRCYERESVPYQALDSIVDDLVELLAAWPQADVQPLFSEHLGPLLHVFPGLGRIVRTARREAQTGAPPEARETRRLAIEALRNLLARLAARRPVVVVVDDLQWGDADGAVLLGDLIAQPDPPPLMLIACYRSEEAAASHLLQGFLTSLRNSLPDGHRHEIALGPLSTKETRQLAQRLLASAEKQNPVGNALGGVPLANEGESAGTSRNATEGVPYKPARAHSATIAEEVARESGGNPYFAGELVRHAIRAPRRDSAKLDLETILSERVGQLPGPAQQLLDLVAVAGHPVRYLDACLAAGTEP